MSTRVNTFKFLLTPGHSQRDTILESSSHNSRIAFPLIEHLPKPQATKSNILGNGATTASKILRSTQEEAPFKLSAHPQPQAPTITYLTSSSKATIDRIARDGYGQWQHSSTVTYLKIEFKDRNIVLYCDWDIYQGADDLSNTGNPRHIGIIMALLQER
ncbi:hypothetical protein BDZ45DRAFT_745940 [Acephala macrosclerotiorum]|nr:hypothetical protein BDZ45DRAFT_745940 [Acephala macrosclerotiorum]